MKLPPIPPLILLAGLAVIYGLYRFLPELNIFTIPLAITGLGIFALGGLVALAGALTLATHRTTISFGRSTTLVTSGIFSLTRNPMYLAIVLTHLGAAFFSTNAVALAMPLASFLCLQAFIKREEEKMEQEFGEQFRQYREAARRWL